MYWFAYLSAKEEMFITQYFNHLLKWVSPVMHQLTAHYTYQDFCKEHHAELDTLKCAMAYQIQKKMNDHDEILEVTERADFRDTARIP